MGHHHEEKHFEQSDFIKDCVIGMADGLTVPFALAAGLSGVVNSNAIILTAGIAEICAGSIAMGLGGYLAGRTEIEHYNSELKREYQEIETHYETEKLEVREIFAEYGLSETAQHTIVDEMAKNKHKWVEFMMRYELGLEKPDEQRATKSAMTIGVSYVIGGVIPLSGYMISNQPSDGLLYSVIVTIVCLFIFGFYKSKLTGQKPFAGALKTTLIGVTAASAAFFIAKIFGN
jgi:VIT1/CCC1 family predicted Fe2+/Mn2+ transporter